MSKKLTKGQVQDALNGLTAPQVAGIFAATGQQGMRPATLGLRPAGDLGPTSSVPGVSATLLGGESPLIIPAEGGVDYTMEKKMAEKAEKRARKLAKKSGLAKAMRDPVRALSRLELLAGQLPARHPARLRAAAVVLRQKLAMQAEAQETGSIVKAIGNAGDVDVASEVAASLSEVERALGISASSAPWQPARIDARSQLQAIIAGTSPSQSLSGTQNRQALTADASPAAAAVQAVKSSGLGEALIKAEAEVRVAETSGDSTRLSTAHQNLTVLKLKVAHRAEGI
jgi:hypothetical protein